jgi:hypothetical protein
MYDPMGQEEFKQFYVDSGITKQDKYTIDRIITMDTYETSFATSKSKNARVSYDMTSLRSVHGYKQDYLFCFHIENTETTPFFANGRVFLAKNVTDYACDLFFDTRYASAQSAEPNLYKKINPFDYLEYTLPSDVVACVKFSDVQSVESTLSAPTFVKCEIEGLNVNDKVMICHSGIMVRDITSSEWVSIDGKWWSIRIDRVRKGVLLYWPDAQNPCESNLNALDTRAEIYKTFAFIPNTYIFTTVSALHFGTNCVIELKGAIPGTVLPMKKVYVNKVVGTTEINQKDYLIAWISGSRKRLVLYDLQKSPEPHPQSQNLAVIDSSGYSEYDVTVENNGNLYLYFETVEGLNHLVGQEIILCVDGNKDARKNIVVPSTGTIALSNPAMYCSAGLKMKSFLKLVPFSGGSVLGSSQGTVGSQKDMAIYLYNSLGGRYGAEADETYSMSYQYKKNTLTDHAQNLFTGLIKLPLPNAKNIYNRTIYIEHDEPTSFNILSITHEISVSDS